MRKSILALFLCIALILSACSSSNSSSGVPSPEAALMAQFEGMYVAKDGINQEYYLFSDGNVYTAAMTDYTKEVARILEDTLNSFGTYAWASMDFQDVLGKLDPMNVFSYLSDVRIDVANNAIILHEGTRDEKMIVLSENSLSIHKIGAVGVAPVVMDKLADAADFSDKRFEAAFKATKEKCTAPASMFWPTPSDYATQIKKLHPEIKDWNQLTDEVWQQPSPIKGVSSSFVVTSSSITLIMGRNDNTDVTAFMVSYTPDSSGSQIAISSRMGYGLEELMQYVEIALGGFPGELTAKEISRRIGSRYSPNGALNLEVTVEYLDFHFVRSSEYLPANTIVLVQADQVSLAPLLTDNEDTTIPADPKPSTPSDSPADPEPTTPTEPTNPQPTTPPETPTEPEPTTPPCDHQYAAATCTTPKTCIRCGNTTGKAAGHSWKEATCTAPATCTACQKTSGEPAGHDWNYTECRNCDATDFSCISKQVYTDIACYDAKSGVSYDVENVSISDTGVLTFTFKGTTYSLTLKQTRGDYWESYYDCYINGVLEPDAVARTSRSEGLNFHFTWWYLDGCNLYFGLFPE